MGNCGLSSKPSVSSQAPPQSPVTNQSSISENAKTFDAKYKKGKQLGKGGYSVVYEVENKRTKKKFAAKQIKKASLNEEDLIGLRQEVDILGKLNHDHIVKLYDFFEEDEYFFVVLELLEGGELFDRIVSKSYYNEKEARDLVYILFTAIKYCHDHNVVHRDLKPENLLLSSKHDDKDVKIADFGFAKVASGFNLTTQCGSPGYVAPEILENKKYGTPTDMWSAGVITYILLGGYPPFHDEGKDQATMFRNIRKGKYEFHAEYWGHVSPEAKDLIRGLLTVDMHKRLTVDQALNHSWIKRDAKELAGRNLGANLQEFKKFHGLRKFRAAAKLVIAVRRMSRTSSRGSDVGGEGQGSTASPEVDGSAREAIAALNDRDIN